MSTVTVSSPVNGSSQPSGSNVTVNWSVSPTPQYAYQIRYRKVTTNTTEPYIYDSGKTVGTTATYAIPSANLAKKIQYEIQIRVWTGSAGGEDQSPWVTVTFNIDDTPIDKVRVTKGAGVVELRVVPLGKSYSVSPVRVKTDSGVGEFDLVPLSHVSESGVRIKTGSAVMGIAKPYPNASLYTNYSETAYIQYDDYYDYGDYSNYSNWTDSYYQHTDSGYYNWGYAQYYNV